MKNKNNGVLFFAFFFLTFSVLSAQIINGSFESKFKRYQKNETFSGAQTQNWNVTAWKGERIHKQIVLWSNTNVNGLSYNVGNLTDGGVNHIMSSNISLRFAKYIKGDPEARSCSEYPTHPTAIEIADALSKEEVNVLSSTDPLKLWVTINVPSNAVAGNYTGTITVNGGAIPLVFTIVVNVVDYTLPNVENWSFHLDLWQFPVNILNHYNTANPINPITMWSDEHFALFEPAYKLLANAGQKAITTYIKDGALGAESMVKWIKKTNGTWEYDFTAFDKYVSTLMSWGITKQIDCFSPVGWNEAIIPYHDEATNSTINLNAPLGSTEYNVRWNHFLTAFKIHLDSKGWFNKVILYLDEVSEAKLLNVTSLVHGNNANWKLGIAYSHGLSNASKANFYDLSGILEDASNNGITSDKISTFYTSCTQTRPNNYVTPENNPAEMTWMGWHAFKENYDGYLRWAFDYWQLSDPFDARDGGHTAGDFSIIYRGSNGSPSEILSSIRFEMLREGIQDFEKLKILKTSLEGSSNPYDQEILNELNNIINDFDRTSGVGAKQLIIRGQKAIADITLGSFSYCKVNGGANSNYYVKSLTSSGGDDNLNFSTSQFPNFGYEHHTISKVSALPGNNIMLNLINSSTSNCARTKVWIDWNGDNDFEDAGEEVFSGGDQDSCGNSVSYNILITVPANVGQGLKRIRVQVRDAFEAIPTACGTNNKTGTADFDLNVLDVYCGVIGTGDYNANQVITTGGTTNINYSGSRGVDNYSLSTEKITMSKLGVFNLSVTNSNGWSRSMVWIDWNGDGDFEDVGEHLPPLSPEKVTVGTTPTYSLNITVPSESIVGTHKIRIVTGDAWTYEDAAIPNTPCGIPTPDETLENAAIKDFNIEIIASLGLNELKKSEFDFDIYPNPLKTKVIIQSSAINNHKADVFIFSSLGQIIYTKAYDLFQSPETIIFPKMLKSGMYFLKVNALNKNFTFKLIKG